KSSRISGAESPPLVPENYPARAISTSCAASHLFNSPHTLSSLTAAKTASTAKRAMVPTLTIIRARTQLQAEVLRAKELVDAPAVAPGHLYRARTRAAFDADFVSGPASMSAVWAAVGRLFIALDRSLPPPSRNHTR